MLATGRGWVRKSSLITEYRSYCILENWSPSQCPECLPHCNQFVYRLHKSILGHLHPWRSRVNIYFGKPHRKIYEAIQLYHWYHILCELSFRNPWKTYFYSILDSKHWRCPGHLHWLLLHQRLRVDLFHGFSSLVQLSPAGRELIRPGITHTPCVQIVVIYFGDNVVEWWRQSEINLYALNCKRDKINEGKQWLHLSEKRFGGGVGGGAGAGWCWCWCLVGVCRSSRLSGLLSPFFNVSSCSQLSPGGHLMTTERRQRQHKNVYTLDKKKATYFNKIYMKYISERTVI